MASQGRTIPSVLGGGLERATATILETLLTRQAFERQDRQLTAQERAAALNQFTTLSGFFPRGTTLGDAPQLQSLFTQAFDVPAEGLEDLELNPETFENALGTAFTDLLDDPEFTNNLLPAFRSSLGLEPSADVAAVRDLEASMRFNALTEITRDTDLTSEFVARTLGRDPVSLTIPGAGGAPDRQISFDSTTAANIYAQFLLNREQFSMRLQLEGENPLDQLIEEISGAISTATDGQTQVSSTAIKGKILPLYNQAVESGNIEMIAEFLARPSTSEGERLAMEFLIGSISTGEAAFLDSLPTDLRTFFIVGQEVREILGPEAAQELMPSLTESLGEQGIPIGQLRDPFFGGLTIEFGGRPAAGDQSVETTGPVGGVPQATLIQAAENLLREGAVAEEDLISQLGAGVVQAAKDRIGEQVEGQPAAAPPPTPERTPENERPVPEGGIDPASVPEEARADVQRLNAFIRQQQTATIPTPSLTQVIKKARETAERSIALAQVELPIVTTERNGIPAGGIDPSEVPTGAARNLALRLNAVLRTLERSTGSTNIDSLRRQERLLKQRIREAIAGKS